MQKSIVFSHLKRKPYIFYTQQHLQEKQRESYALQICAGMKYLSQNKCVHRNLRLEHVYMTNLNDVVITNFGLARVTEALYYQQRTNMASDTFVIYPPEVRAEVLFVVNFYSGIRT